MPFTNGCNLIVALALLAACRTSAVPDPALDAGGLSTATSVSESTETQTPRTAWPSKTATAVVRLRVRALTCHGCAWQIGETLAKNDGVADVSSSVPDKLVTVRYDGARTTPAKIRAALAEVGYESEELP